MENNNCNKSIHSYQSANLTDEEIVNSFIVRKKEFQRIMSEIKRDDMTGSIQHYLLVGRRGSGKSTLLRRIQAEVNKDENLNKRLIVVYLSEEQAGVYRLHDLWDLVIREFNSQNIPANEPNWTDYENDLVGYTQSLYKTIQETLKQQNKKLLLLLDNIDRIFDNIKDDAHYLRELLINHKDLRIIGGSTRMSEHYWKYDKPFYEFFRIVRLESLKKDEVKELLLYWSDCLNMPDIEQFIKKNPGKMETIRVLTDGMPRTLLNFLEILIDRPNQNGFGFLRMIIDRASPLYQERLTNLPPAQRKVVLELSNFWDAVKVKPLIDTCKMPGKIISAQLNQLVKNGIVEKIATGKKDKLYRLSERFFNLWLLMTQGGSKEKQQVKYLTVFLENWYSMEELATIYKEHLEGLNSNKLKPDYAAMMSTALAQSKHLSLEQRDSIIEKTQLLEESSAEYLNYIPPSSKEIFNKAIEKTNQGNYSGARDTINLIEQEDATKLNIIGFTYFMEKDFSNAKQYFLQAIENGEVDALNNLAILYSETDRKKEAEKYYLQAIEKGHVEALNNLANLYHETDSKEEAEKYYLLAIEKGHVYALYNLAILYSETDYKEKAEKYYLLAIEKGHVYALYNLAILYSETDYKEKAEKYFQLAIEKGNIDALNNLANLYWRTDHKEKAKKYYLLAIDKGNVDALYNLAILYSETGHKEEAEKYYLQAIEKGHVVALYNLAILYSETDRKEDSEKYYLQAIEKGHVNALNNMALLYRETDHNEEAEKYYLQAIEKGDVNALNNLASLYRETDRKEEAEKYYLLAIEKDDVDAIYNLAIMYYHTNRNKNQAIDLIEKYMEKSNNYIGKVRYTETLLWAGLMKEFNTLVQKLVPELVKNKDIDNLQVLFVSFLIHKQYHLAWQWFKDSQIGQQLKEMIKPIYFVTAGLLPGKEQAEEILKQGPELEDSIKQLNEYIKERQKVYY
jgi:TPR repeat protein/DNA polymerase III delta prime subunit